MIYDDNNDHDEDDDDDIYTYWLLIQTLLLLKLILNKYHIWRWWSWWRWSIDWLNCWTISRFVKNIFWDTLYVLSLKYSGYDRKKCSYDCVKRRYYMCIQLQVRRPRNVHKVDTIKPRNCMKVDETIRPREVADRCI